MGKPDRRKTISTPTSPPPPRRWRVSSGATTSSTATPRSAPVLRRYAPLWPLLNWGLFVVGLVFITAVLTGLIEYGGNVPVFEDGRNYWQGQAYTDPHYRYSPAFLWATAPLRVLPVEAFGVVWTALHVVAVAWLGPWMLALPGVADDVIAGNVNVFLAVAIVLKWWPLVLLTKVTPGVGLLHHVARKEWRMVLGAIGVTFAVVVVGALIDPDLWIGWLDSLRAGTENYATIDVLAPLPVRAAIGAILCALAARWVWLLPVGMTVAMPGLWPSSFALLAAIPRLLADDDRKGAGPATAHRRRRRRRRDPRTDNADLDHGIGE